MLRVRFLFLAFLFGAGCAAAGGHAWLSESPESEPLPPEKGWIGRPSARASELRVELVERASHTSASRTPAPDDADEASSFSLHGRAPLEKNTPRGSEPLYRNTYYDFPREGAGDKSATIFDGSCTSIARVTRAFHDQLCVQGSGRLESGATVSFARRDCACAELCPRTGQHICFERLDPIRFPHGRGATGHAITPLKTIAVDSAVIPLGTHVYIPEFVGLPRPDGTLHTGCFLAEDRGIKVTGRQVDVFTGDPELTSRWNKLLPSNQGVHVVLNDPRCSPGG